MYVRIILKEATSGIALDAKIIRDHVLKKYQDCKIVTIQDASDEEII